MSGLRNIQIAVLGLTAILSQPSFVSAAPTVGSLLASPQSIVAGVATPVVVSVQITDPTVQPNGVNLLQVDSTGATIALLGTMTDTNGEFMLTPSFNPAAGITQILLQASAAFKGALQRVKSPVLTIPVTSAPVTISISPTSLTFPAQNLNTTSAPQTFTIANFGHQAITLSSITTSGDFAISANSCPASLAIGANCAVSITFTPTATGTRTASVIVADNAAGSPQSVSLTGSGQSSVSPTLTFNPTSLTFSAQNLNTTSVAQGFTITNSGTQAVTLNSITAFGDFAVSSNACKTTLAASAHCDVSVTFTPTATGTRTSSLSITDTATGSPQSISLTGTGQSPSPTITLNPTFLNFPAQNLNTTSATQSFTITNSGGQAVTISSVKTMSDFAIRANVCPASLAVGANCSVGVTFTPTAAGTRRSRVVITDSATGSPQSIALSGTGQSANPFTITSFSPRTGAVGTPVNVVLNNFTPAAGIGPTVTMAGVKGGAISAPVTQYDGNTLSFVVPDGGGSGPFTITVGSQKATSPSPFTVKTSSQFTLTIGPMTANLIQGQTVSYAVILNSTDGFDGLAKLAVGGLPSGLQASFKPQYVTAGQTATLTISAPANQAKGSARLSVSASATIDGQSVSQTATASLQIAAVTTSFLGRTAVDDSQQTPLAGVTVKFMGKDSQGNTTGCAGKTVSDAAGNFSLTGLPAGCIGPQLIGYDGTTATSPAGKYAGVNLAYKLTPGQVTSSPVLVHLPRIDNGETVHVQQNASVDQVYSFQSMPGLRVTVYAGTKLSLDDGSQPNPFPLTGVQIPVDRLPDKLPTNGLLTAFVVAFQPANAYASQPVAVDYPNTLYNSPGASSSLMTLDPTRGFMVPYGTAAVSSDATQYVPDMDPTHPGHRYGLVHFDWHMVGTPLGNQMNPCGGCTPCPRCGGPVDLSSGLEVINETDISFGGARGTMSVTRTYRNGINPAATTFGPFGWGTNHNWGYELDSVNPSTTSVISLIMPDGNRYPFSKQGNGSFVNFGVPTLGGGVMTVVDSKTVDLRWKDGTTYRFTVIFDVPVLRTLLDSVTDPNGNRLQITHNGFQIQAITDPTGRSLQFNYNVEGNITQITAPDGSNVSYDYRGNNGMLLRQVRHADGSITRYSYDVRNNLTSVTDGNGVTFESNSYDANDRVTSQVLPNGGSLKFSYTLQNPAAGILSPVLATTVTDENSNQTTYRFSPNQAVISVTDPLGRIRTIDRDGANFVVGFHGNGSCGVCGDIGAGDQMFSYDDSTGNLLYHTDALGNTTSYVYEPVFNQLVSISDPLGKVTSFTIDSKGNRLSQTDPNGNTTRYAYDQFGELVTIQDPSLQTTTLSYDSFGNVSEARDPLGDATRFQYDSLGRVTGTQDSLGRTTAATYDGMGRIRTRTNSQGGTTRFTYDELGDLLSVTDALGRKTSFTYDWMRHLLTRTDPLGRKDTRTYDLNGNLKQFVDRRGQTSIFAYDVVNRMTTETYSDTTVTRSYDANDRLSQVNDSASGAFSFSYDLAGRMISSFAPFGSVSYGYDKRNSVTSRQVAGRPTIVYTYDPVGNLVGATLSQAAAAFSYNERNQIASINRPNGVSSGFSYDHDGRLLSLTHAKGASVVDAESYVYNIVGDRASHNTSIDQTPVTQPAANQYDVANELTAAGPTANSYDLNGNLLYDGNASYTWDSRNRLKSVVTLSGQTTTFTYDFAGNLIQQADNGKNLNVTSKFVLDGLTNLAFETASDGTFYDVLSGQSVDSNLAIVQSSGQIQYGLTDALNSTVATVDQSGELKGQYRYDAFGKMDSAGAYPFQYTGRPPISTSLYYYRARFYNSQTGRFISEDPIGFGSGDGNLYLYAQNNPTKFTDPSGLYSLYDLGNFAAGFGDTITSLFGFFDTSLTQLARERLGGDAVGHCSNDYRYGRYASYAWGSGTLWTAGLYGGSSSAFWAGRGASTVAGGLGTTIGDTPIGGILNALGVESRGVWAAASATFAANASGTATAVIRYVSPNSLWLLERAILNLRSIPIVYR